MGHYSRKDLSNLPSRFRANLINTCTGYKSSNLLATCSKDGITNVAMFNSIVHIGSNPALLGFILRPLTVRRDTYINFKESGFFTVNQVHKTFVRDAHQTSAKYEKGISEFSKTSLTEKYLDGFQAPYVAESIIKIGCRYQNEYHIEENGCLLIIGAIEHLYLPDEIVHDDGWVRLDMAETVSTVGLDGYALPKLLERFAYALPDEETTSLFNGS